MRWFFVLPLALCACAPVDQASLTMPQAIEAEEARAERRARFNVFAQKSDGPPADKIAALSEIEGELRTDPNASETALLDVTAGSDATPKPAGQGGVFGLFRRPSTGDATATPASLQATDADGALEPPRETAPFVPGFGAVVAACGATKRDMGKEVARWPDKGARQYRVFDANPNSVTLRDFYLTGFRDGCPRKFRATTVFFGAPSTYEVVRYDPANRSIARTQTDAAYDTLKRRMCGVGPSKPCGAKVGKMDRSVVFLTAYDHFGTVTRWNEILLHNKSVAASAIKSR